MKIARVGDEGYAEIIADTDESQEQAPHRRVDVHVEMVKEIAILAREVSFYSSNTEALWQALWCTLLGDQRREQNMMNERVDLSYEEVVGTLKALVIGSEGDLDWPILRENTPRRMEFNDLVHRASYQRRFCVTRGCRLEWVPRYAREGSGIAIIAGIGVPIALRLKTVSYEVLRNYYMHGIMN